MNQEDKDKLTLLLALWFVALFFWWANALLGDTNDWLHTRQAQVIKVIDGDTIRVIVDTKFEIVRLIGIDAPESTTLRYGHTEAGGTQSTKHLKELLSWKDITLESDWEYDVYGRLLGSIYVWDENINKKMVKDWFATKVFSY